MGRSECEDNSSDTGEKKITVILPEVSIPTVSLRIPEMKKDISFWQLGMTSPSRVQISSLRPDVKINTKEAQPIMGMFSEGYGEIETLGTAIVHIYNKPFKVYVTRSRGTAPIVSDGILSSDFYCRTRAIMSMTKLQFRLPGFPLSIPAKKGEDLMPNYVKNIQKRIDDNAIARKKGQWSVGCPRFLKVKPHLPAKVTKDDRLSVIEIIDEFADVFYIPSDNLPCTSLLKYKIRTKNNNTINIPQYNLSEKDWKEIDRQVENLLDQKIIRYSNSPYNSPVRLFPKKPDCCGVVTSRLAPDFQELNKNSEGDAFPIPDIVELTDLLHGSKYFSVFDLASASYQIDLEPSDREKTAFSTRNGKYEFLRMPVGIKNASQNIQRLLNLVIDDMLYSPSQVFVSYDDIIVYAATIEEHEVIVRKLLSRIHDAGLKLQPKKCQLFQHSVSYLGYLVTDQGLRPDPAKVQRIRNSELPKDRNELSSFLGLSSYFKRFIPNYAKRVKSLGKMLKNDESRFEWTSEAKKSFNDLKTAISQELLLYYPDWTKTFILQTSSSDVAIEAALYQRVSKKKRNILPIAYASRCYTQQELKYTKQEQECLAAMYGMDTWYWCLDESKQFILRTPDPRAFDWYTKRKTINSDILSRFELTFCGRDFVIEASSCPN